MLTSSWNKATGVDLNTTEPLFTLVLQAGQAVRLSESMVIASNPTQAEAYTTGSDIMDLSLTFRGSEAQLEFELLQNEPNPFNQSTQISYIVPSNGEATLTLFDMTGKQVLVQQISSVKGLNKVEIRKDQIDAQGMIYYQVQFQGYTATKKMLIL
jgi:hypothetical protein